MHARKEEAARLLAEDDLTDEEIARRAGITRRQLTTWKQDPSFRQAVNEHVALIRDQILSRGYARVEKRVQLLDTNLRRLEAIVEAQRENPDVRGHPGADTGLIFYKEIPTRTGKAEEFFVHTALLAEERALLSDIAKHTGQWIDRISANFDPSILTDEELETIARRNGRSGTGDPPPRA